MTIRSRLILLLLPLILTYIFILSAVVYFHAPFTIILVSLIAALLITALLFIFARKISHPIEELKDAALSIAAGNYETNISIKGPKEIVELASTLNTMSECLKEQIARLQESALMRERMYGEYECSVLLQHYMLQRVMQNYTYPELSFRSLDLLSDHLQGLILNISHSEKSTLITLVEAEKRGFQGIYELLATAPFLSEETLEKPEYPSLKLHFNHETYLLDFACWGLPKPFIWSRRDNQRLESMNDSFQVQKGDLVFLYNQGFLKYFQNDNALSSWFGRVLKHFSQEGIESACAMLEKELLFFSRKRHIDEDIHLISIEIK